MKATAQSSQSYAPKTIWIQPSLFPECVEQPAMLALSSTPPKPLSKDQIYIQDLAADFEHQRGFQPEEQSDIWEDELTIGTSAYHN